LVHKTSIETPSPTLDFIDELAILACHLGNRLITFAAHRKTKRNQK
jgi:hypothetical protein